MKKITAGLILFLGLTLQAAAQPADSIRLHIDSCLDVLEKHSLYADKQNWPALRRAVHSRAAQAMSKAETFDALKIAFDALGDKHAAYYHYNHTYKLDNTALLARYSDSIRAAWSAGPQVKGMMIGRIAYLRVPYMGATKQQDIDWYANWLYDTLRMLQQKKPEGWIIDLRLNGGGNIRPMLAGLAPFFYQGLVSYYLDRHGTATDKSEFRNGDFFVDDQKAATLKQPMIDLSAARVAVLTGAGTASSGEITAAIFKQRPKTVLIGEETAGLANATAGFVISEEVYFLVSAARIADKDKKVLPEKVQPHNYVKSNDAFQHVLADSLVQKALDWLK